jgi:hypothetical protein
MQQFYTEEQRKDAVRLRRYIERERLCSVMNSTKWQEAIQVPFSREGTAIRIWGYTRPGASPDFVEPNS